jgi:2-keto-4-pentenoate hydratase
MSATLLNSGELTEGPAAATIAFVLGADVTGSTMLDVLSATRAVCPVIVAGDRHMVGSPVPVPAADLRLLGVVLEHNGEVVATAAGAASLGHPAAAVAELAGELQRKGGQLRAGDVVVTAPLASVGEVRAGDVLVASVGRVGTVEAAVG